jgi:hypothetical protein
MSREQVFDSEIKKFFDISVKILETYQKNQIVSSDNHTLRNLQRYKIVYNMTEVDSHIPYFQKIFRTYRDDLYNVLKEDKWLMDENIVIQYGEEIEDPELRKRSEKRKIEISSIYKTAVQLRNTFEESLKGLPESARENAQELIFPHIFLLHLFRIFFSIYPQNKEIQKVVQTLEKELGMNSTPNKKSNPLAEIAQNAQKILGNGNTNLLQSLLPPDLKLPSNDEMANKLQEAMRDPVVNETLGATMNSVMGAKNIGEGISLALKSLENPKFMEGLLKTVNTLIPAETLNAITKSTEQLKENGEIKNALSSLGLPSEINISQILSDQLNQLKITGSEQQSESVDLSVQQSTSSSPSENIEINSTSQEISNQDVVENHSTTPNIQQIAEDSLKNITSGLPTDMIDMLKNPNLLQMFNQFQQQLLNQNSSSSTTEEKSLIDF